MKKGKVQTNEEKINVLVEHEDGTNTHFKPTLQQNQKSHFLPTHHREY